MWHTFSYQDATLSYRTEGKGRPVLLLHGFGEDSHIWDQQVSFLKDHCRLILPDLPGTGASTLLHPLPTTYTTSETTGEAWPSLSDYAEAIHALLVHEKATPCLVLGHSMGGYIALALAESYPASFAGLGLVHSTAFADNPEKKATRLRAIATMEQYGAASFLKTTLPNLFGERFKNEHPGKILELITKSETFSTQALQQYYHAMMERPDRTAVLKSNPIPVLFVMGTEDQAVPMDDVLQQTHLPLISYIHILEGVGHMGMWEDTAAMNEHLLAFIHR